MNLHNALGFALVGLAMRVLPLLFPSLIEVGGPEGTRALWLWLMSWVMWGLTAWGVAGAAWEYRQVWLGSFGSEGARAERRREVLASGSRTVRVAQG
ncbi:MAG: hypothetical protein U1F61_10605 [Opitutaceae bacterium]